MPKKYVHTKRGKTVNYDNAQLEKAVSACKQGMSIRKASASFGIPKSTLGDRVSGRFEIHVQRERPPCIPAEIENKIVDSVKMAARRGIGLTRKQVLLRTNILCKRLKIGSGYPSFVAGKDWWEGVKRRHPDITIRKPEKLSSTRARMMNKEVIRRYFDDLQTILEGLRLTNKPGNIWNCDEMGKSFEHDPVRVVSQKGQNCVAQTSSRSTNITVMACVNAEGKRMPPMFVVKGKTSKSLHGFNTELAPAEARWFFQKNGWMDDQIGEHWFQEVFLKFCGPERPQLLILDGLSSHETVAILQCAIEQNIHLLSLPPHTTHYLQPLDRFVFGPLNREYNQACTVFLQESPVNQVNKRSFPLLFKQSWDKAVTQSNIKSGFRAYGIYPMNRSAIPDAAFGPSLPTDVSITPKGDQQADISIAPKGDQHADVSMVPKGDQQADVSMAPKGDQHADVSMVPKGDQQANISVAPKDGKGQSPADIVSCIEQQNDVNNNIAVVIPPVTIDEHMQEGVALENIHIDASSTQATSDTPMWSPKVNDMSGIAIDLQVESLLSDNDLSLTSSILDLSDPTQLFNLIQTGELLCSPLMDEHRLDIVVSPSPVLPQNHDQAIEELFIPPSLNAPKENKQRRAITKHRLLTSQEIVNEKLKAVEQKLQRELKKKQNYLKRATALKPCKKNKLEKQ